MIVVQRADSQRQTTALRIPQRLIEVVDRQALDRYPEECCGALLGKGGRVVAVWPTLNAHAGSRSDRYRIDTTELLLAHKSARERGLEIIGYYHSHPDAAARPSARDLATALPDTSYLIVTVIGRQVRERRCWRLQGDGPRFVEERLVRGVEDGSDPERG